MRCATWLRLWLGCGLACQILLAQAQAIPDEDEDKPHPSAEVKVVPSLRGDLSVRIITWDMPDAPLEAIRQAYLLCDWRPDKKGEDWLYGVCRRYLRSDGTSAQGTVALAPLVRALHKAGAETIRVVLDDFGVPLAVAPRGWRAKTEAGKTPFGSLKSTKYVWLSYAAPNLLPEPLAINIGTPWSPSRLTLPLGFTLFAPALLALWLRRRAERRGAVEAASIWVHWLLTGMWLYWISAVSATDLAAFAIRLQLDSMALTLVIGTALFAGVPLVSAASCVAVLMRAPADAGQPAKIGGLVLRSVMREAILIIPLGIFVVGTAMFVQDWHISLVSLPAAFITYKLLNWWVGRRLFGGMETLSRGALLEVTSVIARRAGVALGGIYIIANRVPEEANAFAAGGKTLAMTRGLVEHLTCRELVAVIGHEMGHLRKNHIATRLIAFWGYVVVVGPAAASIITRFHLPQWLLSLPILPLGYILATSLLSRNHEFTADAEAVELVADAEGMIAALARLSKLTRSPVDWGGIQGSILSHPSMRDRVLAIARKFNVPEDRALALLSDPDLISAGTSPDQLHYPLPAECAGPGVLFSSSWRQAYSMWAQWAGYLAMAAITLAIGQFALSVWPRPPYVIRALGFGLPIAAWLYLEFMNLMDRTAMKYLRWKLSRRMATACAGGTFVGLLPGDRFNPAEGFCLWDAGFLFLTPDHLTYHGERASFVLARTDVQKISIEKGPLAWDRDRGTMITCADGSFSLTRPDRGTSWFQARQLEKRLSAWVKGESIENDLALAPVPPAEPAALVSQVGYLRGWRAVRTFVPRAFMLWIGLIILFPYEAVRWTPAIAFVPFMSPLAYLIACFPLFLRGKPTSAKEADASLVSAGPGPEIPEPAG